MNKFEFSISSSDLEEIKKGSTKDAKSLRFV
jgi:hypothetical protein